MTACIEFIGSRNSRGYGRLNRKGCSTYAHRQAWIDHNLMEIPKGKVIMHTCDNPPCINPAHLRLGEVLDNIQDRQDKGRQARGAANARSVVTSEMVEVIKTSPLSSRALGSALGISHTAVLEARRGNTFLSSGSP